MMYACPGNVRVMCSPHVLADITFLPKRGRLRKVPLLTRLHAKNGCVNASRCPRRVTPVPTNPRAQRTPQIGS